MVRLSFKKVCKHYYDIRKNKVDPDYYEGKFEDIKEYFKNKPITYDTVGGFFVWLSYRFEANNGRPISNSYKNKYLQLLKVCAKLSGTNIDEVKGDNEAFDRVETEKMNLDEYERLMATWIPYKKDAEYKNFYDLLIIKIAIITTQRPGNIAGLLRRDYINGYLYFRGRNTPKNGVPHKVYLPEKVQSDIARLRVCNEYLLAIDSRGKFTNFWLSDMLKKRCKLAGITKHITAKSLRGTGATQYLKKYEIQKVMQITGHKDPQVLIDHYYDPENKEIEAILNDNPFDPTPLTDNEIRSILNDTMERLNKRKCQALVIERDRDYLFTVPKVG